MVLKQLLDVKQLLADYTCQIQILRLNSEPEDDPPEPQPASFSPQSPERPFTPGAAKIAEEAPDEPTVNAETAADDLMTELKDDVSSSEKFVPRSLSPDIELEERL